MRDFIPQIEPWIDNLELQHLKEVIDSTYVTEHKMTERFETLITDLTNARYAISTTNGTAALFCCLKALDIGPGDEVIVPNITFVASSNAVIMAGATPVFCEIKDIKLQHGVHGFHMTRLISTDEERHEFHRRRL